MIFGWGFSPTVETRADTGPIVVVMLIRPDGKKFTVTIPDQKLESLSGVGEPAQDFADRWAAAVALWNTASDSDMMVVFAPSDARANEVAIRRAVFAKGIAFPFGKKPT